LAGPEAGSLGRCGRLVKRDVLAARLARGAAWPAIDPGRPDRIEEPAVLRRIMGDHGRPALVCVQHRELRHQDMVTEWRSGENRSTRGLLFNPGSTRAPRRLRRIGWAGFRDPTLWLSER